MLTARAARRGGGARCRSTRWPTRRPYTTSPRRAPPGWTSAAPSTRSPCRAGRLRRALLGLLALADDRVEGMGLPPVRSAGRDQHAGRCPAPTRPSCASKARGRALAVTTDCNGALRVPRSPGGRGDGGGARRPATSSCSRRAALGVTDCLNFGSPERPEILWQFEEAIEGIADACRALDIPVVGGNVSFYNETLGRAILPTPVIGVVGFLDDADGERPSGSRQPGDRVVLLGPDAVSLGGSEYLCGAPAAARRRAGAARPGGRSAGCRRPCRAAIERGAGHGGARLRGGRRWRWRWPRAASRAAARGRRGGCCRRAPRADLTFSARGRRGSWSRCRRSASATSSG